MPKKESRPSLVYPLILKNYILIPYLLSLQSFFLYICDRVRRRSIKKHQRLKAKMEFRRYFLLGLVVLTVVGGGEAQLRRNFYQGTCPNVEWIVRQAVMRKISQTFVTVPATLRLFFHDCFVEVRSKSSHLNICGFVQCFL